MNATIGYEETIQMLRGAAAQIRENHEMLSKLDSVGGDGDHGTTMLRAMTILEKAIDSCASNDVKSILNDVGWAIMGVDGGATGPLFGTLFMSMAEGLGDNTTMDAPVLLAAFASGLSGVQAQTKAKVGDKTMLDALVPAIDALRVAVEGGANVVDALRAAAEGAGQGAASTKDLQARFGRAKNIKEQSIGTQDPGATSVSLIFRGFWKGVESHA
ncbi:MAG: dihydroxyacetone kinase subunit DhaL [Candidatus Hydrogenedentales bacterium]